MDKLEEKLKEMFGLLDGFEGQLEKDKSEGGDEDKEVKIEELLSKCKDWRA